MDYGRFYNGQHKAQDVNRNVHAECEKKFDTLVKELEECKSQIELLRGQSQMEPVTDDLPQSNRSSPALLLCEGQSPGGARAGKKQEVACSPSSRVSTPVNSRRPASRETVVDDGKEVEPSEGDANGDGNRRSSKTSRRNKHLPPMPRDRNMDKEAVFDRLARPKTAPQRTEAMSRTTRSNRGDPVTSKYDYYKYYGSAGQGAKTSWQHNLPLGCRPVGLPGPRDPKAI